MSTYAAGALVFLGLAAAAFAFVRLRDRWRVDEDLRKWNEQRARVRQGGDE